MSPVWYDDAGHFIVVREALLGNGFCYPAATGCDPDSPFITLGHPLNRIYAAFMGLFGESIFVGRICTILFSLAAAGAIGELARRFFSPSKAVWALLLLIGNIQLLSYGAQILGEMPMMACLLWAILAHVQWYETGKWMWAGLVPLLLFGAVMCKAYIAVPIALAWAIWLLALLFRHEKKIFLRTLLQGAVWGLGLVAYFILEQGGWRGFLDFLEARSSYGSEFFAFDFAEALRFLLLKPLFWLGTGALALRLRIKRRGLDFFLASFQFALLLTFLLSAGYDRFGFLLLFLPAIYFAEFMHAAWERMGRKWALRMGFLTLAALAFYQQTPLIYGQRLLHPEQVNAAEREIVEQALSRHNGSGRSLVVHTYDQQLVPFLPEKVEFRLPAAVPSNAENCRPLAVQPGEMFIEGEYARTLYFDCVPWGELQALDSVDRGGAKYKLWGRRQE